MKRFIFTLIFILLVQLWGYSQTGLGYLNYRVIKTQNGNGTNWTYNGVTYGGMVDNATEFEGMLDLSNPANTLMSSGEVLSNSSAGLAGGNAPGRPGDFFVVEYTGWFYAELGGQYLFYTYSDDAAQVSINGNVLVGKYGGPGTSSAWITLQADTWYPLQFLYHENAGGSYGHLQVFGPKNGYFYPGGANDVYKVSNKKPIIPVSINLEFGFGSSIDKTRFTTKLLAKNNNQYLPTTNVSRTLSGIGKVDMTSDLDTIKVAGNEVRGTTVGGQVEWCVIYSRDAQNRYRVGIDKREFPSGFDFTKLTELQLFDLYDGPVTYYRDDLYWAEYYIYSETLFNWTGSSFSSYLRNGGSYQALRAEFTFTTSQNYKSHGVELNTTNVASLYNNIVTVSDVFLAFKELSNRGLFGNESGLEFSSGVQFMNADVDENGVFDERDTYKLIQHLVGSEIIGNGSNNLSDYMKILPKSEYDLITKLNWSTKPNSTTNIYSPISLSNTTPLNSFNYNVFWKGDVNMSHSASQTNNNVRVNNKTSNGIDVFIMSEIESGKAVVTITIDPLQEAIVGTQFQLNYDNTKLKFEEVEFKTKGNPTNYGNNRGSFINIGSLITNGNGVLDNTTEYRVIFTLLNNTTNILGLTALGETDAVNSNGVQLNVRIK